MTDLGLFLGSAGSLLALAIAVGIVICCALVGVLEWMAP